MAKIYLTRQVKEPFSPADGGANNIGSWRRAILDRYPGKKTTALWAPNSGLRSVERVPRFLLLSDPTTTSINHPLTNGDDMSCIHPHLGLATTREILDELRARFEIHAAGGLDYRTVDGETLAKRPPATAVLVKRPVAYRIPRVIEDKLSTAEWRYFTNEEAAYKEAEALGVDYQALFVRDGTVIVQDCDEVILGTVERCALLIEKLADDQEATNKQYPDHAKAYPNWVDRVQMYRLLASEIRSKMTAKTAR